MHSTLENEKKNRISRKLAGHHLPYMFPNFSFCVVQPDDYSQKEFAASSLFVGLPLLLPSRDLVAFSLFPVFHARCVCNAHIVVFDIEIFWSFFGAKSETRSNHRGFGRVNFSYIYMRTSDLLRLWKVIQLNYIAHYQSEFLVWWSFRITICVYCMSSDGPFSRVRSSFDYWRKTLFGSCIIIKADPR